MSSNTTKTSSSNSHVKSTSRGLLILFDDDGKLEGGSKMSKSTIGTLLGGGVAIRIVLSMFDGSGEFDKTAAEFLGVLLTLRLLPVWERVILPESLDGGIVLFLL